MRTSTLLAVLLIVNLFGSSLGASYPFWKVFSQVGPVYRGRADPIVNPNATSGHSHKVFGASGFSLGGGTPEQVFDEMFASTCTTVSITVDKSAYWIPDLYYQHADGNFSLVRDGGLTVYYLGRSGTGAQTYPAFKAFPRGFRMIAGDPFRRNYTGSVPDQAITFACLSSQGGGPETPYIPKHKKCDYGLRAQVFFPSCWDGVNLDSPNHKDHVAYPTRYNGGNCPASHPVRLSAIFFEILFSVDDFPHGDNVTQPFVFSNGDPLGYGLHGDFLNGWDVELFQQALEDVSCFANNTNNGNTVVNCKTFAPYVKTSNPEGSCILDKPIPNYEDLGINSRINHLPGCNPVTYGPNRAVPCSGVTPQPRISNNTRVLIKSVKSGLFVSSPSSRVYVSAKVEQNNLGYPEVFTLIPYNDNVYAIQTESNSKFVSANNRASTPITGNRNSPGTWEQWRITFLAGQPQEPSYEGSIGTIVSLSNNKYVRVNPNGDLQPNSGATATTITDEEKFVFYDANAVPTSN